MKMPNKIKGENLIDVPKIAHPQGKNKNKPELQQFRISIDHIFIIRAKYMKWKCKTPRKKNVEKYDQGIGKYFQNKICQPLKQNK